MSFINPLSLSKSRKKQIQINLNPKKSKSGIKYVRRSKPHVNCTLTYDLKDSKKSEEPTEFPFTDYKKKDIKHRSVQ